MSCSDRWKLLLKEVSHLACEQTEQILARVLFSSPCVAAPISGLHFCLLSWPLIMSAPGLPNSEIERRDWLIVCGVIGAESPWFFDSNWWQRFRSGMTQENGQLFIRFFNLLRDRYLVSLTVFSLSVTNHPRSINPRSRTERLHRSAVVNMQRLLNKDDLDKMKRLRQINVLSQWTMIPNLYPCEIGA